VAEVEYYVPWDYPKPAITGDTIRIVKVKNGEINDFSILKDPKKVLDEYREFWQHIAFFTTEGFGSYLQPNKPAVFTAYCPTHHGFETSFQWAFGDGSYGSSITVSHSYLQEGDYNVVLNITRRNLFTNETTTTTIVRSLCVRTKYMISVLPPESFATSFPLPVDLTETPTNMYCYALIGENDTEGEEPVAIIGLHFENADSHIDLSNLLRGTDTATRKSVIFSDLWPAEVDSSKWLFVPSSGAGSVYICLNATSLNDVKPENADLVINAGETTGNITVTTAFYDGKEYYLVYGNVTGFGGGEIFHDVAITNVTLSKTTVGQGFDLQGNVTIYDQGTFDENINLTLYVNTTTIAVFHNITLSSWGPATLTFTWNTTGFAYGNYTVSAYAWPVQGEANTTDNTYTYGLVLVTIMGDIDGNGWVNILDAIDLSNSFLKSKGQIGFNPNADFDNNGVVNILDAITLSNYYNQHYS
jgi:hypothetical protein